MPTTPNDPTPWLRTPITGFASTPTGTTGPTFSNPQDAGQPFQKAPKNDRSLETSMNDVSRDHKRDPSGIRTRVTAVRGRRTRPLYDGAGYASP